eukprot:gene34134-biopygen15756
MASLNPLHACGIAMVAVPHTFEASADFGDEEAAEGAAVSVDGSTEPLLSARLGSASAATAVATGAVTQGLTAMSDTAVAVKVAATDVTKQGFTALSDTADAAKGVAKQGLTAVSDTAEAAQAKLLALSDSASQYKPGDGIRKESRMD